MKDKRRFFINQKRLKYELISFAIAIICIYMITMISYEKILKPITIINLFISEKLTCLASGWSDKGTRIFWDYYFYPELPTLQDIYEDNGILTVVLSCMFLTTHDKYLMRSNIFFESKWVLYLHQGNSYIYRDYPINPSDPIVGRCVTEDIFQKVVVLQFTLPEKYRNRFNYATIQMAHKKKIKKLKYKPLNKNEVTYNPSYLPKETELQGYQNYTKIMMKPIDFENVYKYGLYYRNIPFCQIIDSHSIYSKDYQKGKKDFLRICTQNIIFTDKRRNIDLIRWALYHKDQGFETPIVYYNKIIPKNNQLPKNFNSYLKMKNKAMKTLKKAIDDKVINLVNWEFPYAFYFHDQLGQEASCVYRNKNRTKWLGINDVDEFFYNPNPKTKDTVNVTLKKIHYKEFAKDHGGIITPNVWMKIEDDGKKIYQDDFFSEGERTKCIVIPDNVFFYNVHTVDKGLPTVFFNRNNVVNAHFKKVPEDYYKELFFSQKMTDIYQKYTQLAKVYLNMQDKKEEEKQN